MLSVIIPTYNRAKYISRSLASLIDQNYSKNNFEVIVVDDGSVDATKETVVKFKNNLNLKYFKTKHLGVSHARNAGVRRAQGETVVFFDDDAVAEKSWLSNIALVMAKENIITGRVEPIRANIWQYFAPHYNQGNAPRESPVLLEGNCAITKKVFDTVGLFDENLDYGHEGEEFIARVGQKYHVMYYPEVVIYHDYAKGLVNYFQKQKKFGEKAAYLVSRGLRRQENQRSKNSRLADLNITKRIVIKIIARAGGFFHTLGYWQYKKNQ